MDRDFELKSENDNNDSLSFLKTSKRASSHGEKKSPKVWAVASGKGGVGKSFISTSFGITLSKLGNSVVIIDLDLSGANIHTSLGEEPAKLNIRHFFEGTKKLNQLVNNTDIPKLSFIQGFWDMWTPVDFTMEQVQQLMDNVKTLNADYVIIDLGAGSVESHLNLFKMADEKFLVTTPDVTSIEKTYRFIEAYVCNSLKAHSTPEAFEKMLSTLREYRQRKLKKPFSFRSYVKNTQGLSFDIFESLSTSPIRLVVNSSRCKSDEELGHSMKIVCNKYYDLSLDYVCAIDYDNAVWRSLRERSHVLISQPFTSLSGQFLGTCKHLIAPEELRAVI